MELDRSLQQALTTLADECAASLKDERERAGHHQAADLAEKLATPPEQRDDSVGDV